jgi:hypothetical protein
MADISIEIIIIDSLPVFGVEVLKNEQKSILQCHIDKKDCMAVLSTGFVPDDHTAWSTDD